ncbi:hypothetical protein [Poseidonibacter antarcticus]|uniref:hypothetical protein n=1 Tax=Poseidonibacter antarcticus TaxID=2478538 RepID=UPI000EF48251|nr:hypothetical protein [Poseidonibacter antarcticus]
MSPEKLLENSINSIKEGLNTVGNKYDNHIREKAVEKVNEKIHDKGLNIDQIEQDDYEAMVSDLSKDIKEDYAKKASQGLLAVIGLDFLLG